MEAERFPRKFFWTQFPLCIHCGPERGQTESTPVPTSSPEEPKDSALLHPLGVLRGHSNTAFLNWIPDARPFKDLDLVWLRSGWEADL